MFSHIIVPSFILSPFRHPLSYLPYNAPSRLKIKAFPIYFRLFDIIDHSQHNTTSLLMLRYTLLQPISHETELLLLFLLEVSAFLLPSPFFWLLLSLFWPPSLPFSPPSYFCQEGSLFTDIHHHISYDMYLSSHTRGIPKKSGPSDQFRTYSGPLLALRSGSGPSPEFRTLLVPLVVCGNHCMIF